jgi:hypothetical protein
VKAAAAAAVAVAVVAAGGGYALGRRDGAGASPARPPAPRHQRVIVLRDGDVVVRREAATRCEASAEGGFANLFCSRIGGGRHQVIFYSDSVLVWPLDCRGCGPDATPFAYRWESRRAKR